MKIVYCLTSISQDLYYEQALVSMCSLKHHNPEAEIVLLVDQFTDRTLINERSGLRLYADTKLAIEVPTQFNTNAARSRYLKLHVRNAVDGTLLFVDTDTVIVDKLDESSFPNCEIAIALDRHKKTRRMADKTFKVLNVFGYTDRIWNDYHNSGVIYMKDTPLVHKFYELWFQSWKISYERGFHVDQPSLAHVERTLTPVAELSGIWNCQTFVIESLPFFKEAKICHFYGGTGENNVDDWYPRLLNRVKEAKQILPTDMIYIQELKANLLENVVYRLRHTATFYAVCSIYSKHYGLFKKMNSIIAHFKK